jgi:tetratricopeptide (TPR) repeat protein
LHRAEFDFIVSRDYAGGAGNGEIMVYAGPLIIGTIKLALLFEDLAQPEGDRAPVNETQSMCFQQIFASYSHKDTPIVLACRNVFKALGWEVLIDIDTLRSGQVWSKELMNMIDRADIFQLFWSAQAAQSDYVRQEWKHALKCSRGPRFIRPVYWEQPLVPPPEPLAHLHFAYQPLPKVEMPLVAYDQAIQTDPTNPIAYQTKGDALVEQGRSAEALALYDRAITLAPHYGSAYSSKGKALYALGRYEEALMAFEQAIHLQPGSTLPYTRKAATLAMLNRFHEALIASDQATALNPRDVSAFLNKGSVLVNLARYEEALRAYQQAIHLNPNFGLAYYNLGVAFERMGQQTQANQAYQRASELGHA